MSGNGRHTITDEDRARWEQQADEHDRATEQERHIGFVFAELRAMRGDSDAKHAQIMERMDRMIAGMGDVNAAIDRLMDGINTNEKRIRAMETKET